MSNNFNEKNTDDINKNTNFETLVSLHNCGFKLVPLSEDHTPPKGWPEIYENCNYWKIENFSDPKIYSKFKNVASTVGKTHIKDENNMDLYLQVLDIDSEIVSNILSKPLIYWLSNSNMKSNINILIKTLRISKKIIENLSLLDICKNNTFVTKTRKIYGYHIWWLSHMQNKAILSLYCKKDFEFEIKTDRKNSLCTLPPSTHKNDKSFRYKAIGRTDKILITDELYEIFIELLSECLLKKVSNITDVKRDDYTSKTKTENQEVKEKEEEIHTSEFHNLSQKGIESTVDLLLPYYKEGDRHNFTLPFSGAAFHSKISKQSAISIIEAICDKSKDILEKKDRLTTLRSTYKNGIEGRSITGRPTLADLIAKVSGCDLSYANGIVNSLRKLWQEDILENESQRCINYNNGVGYRNQNTNPEELSVTHAKRRQSGFVKIKGTIIGLSPVYNMIKSVNIVCNHCEYDEKTIYPIPVFKTQIKEQTKCPGWTKDHGYGYTANSNFECVSVVDIEIQDLDSFSEIERLSAKIFDDNTFDVIAGEVVTITGNLHVIRKNDNPNNKLETVLFAVSLEYPRKQELVLTYKDIDDIKIWNKKQQNEGKNIINELVKLYVPEVIDLDHIKKGMLMVCVNAGIRNIDTRHPKRLRLNALLIGNPGLAKTTILEKTTKLVPNSQYAGGQSSTGLSLTSQISKEEGGMFTLRFGPVVLAKDSLCAINELGQLPITEHKHLLDCMEENGFPMAKYGFSTSIEAHPSIIASANPVNNKWNNEEVVNFAEFPTLPQIMDRCDFIFVLRENNDPGYLREYATKKKRIAENYKAGYYEGNEEFIRKYLFHAKKLKVEVSEDAYSLLTDFFINMGKAGVSGLPRKLDSLIRITIAIAKLKLKEKADVIDAEEAILFYNENLKYFNLAAELVKNPRDTSCQEIKQVIKENKGVPMLLTEAANIACKRNESVGYYLLGRKKEDYLKINKDDVDENNKLKLRNNYRLTEVLRLIRNDSSFQITGEKPVTLRWNGDKADTKREGNDNNSHPNLQYSLDNIENICNNDDGHISGNSNQKILETNNANLIASSCSKHTVLCDACDVCGKDESCNNKKITETSKDFSNQEEHKQKEQKEDGFSGKRSSLSTHSNLNESECNMNSNYRKYDNNNILDKQIEAVNHNDNKTIKKEDSNCNTKTKNNIESSFSHTSHASHIDNENNFVRQSQNIKSIYEVDGFNTIEQSKPRIPLKHSPNADIFTNNDVDEKKLETIEISQYQEANNNNDNPFTSSTKLKER